MRRLIHRLRSEWRLKLWLTIGLNLGVCAPYYFLQQHHFFPATLMRPTALDEAVPFLPAAVWLYLSIYLLMPIPPLLMTSRSQLARYAVGMAAMSLLADVVFLWWPTVCERPTAAQADFAYNLLTQIDNPFDAFPSLHAAFAVFTALCADLLLRESQSSTLWRCGLWTWVALILWATLATRQHVAVDLLAGAALAILSYLLTIGRVASRASICSTAGVPSTNAQHT